MKLSDVELIPGTVVTGQDPERLGRVKAKVPNVFESENPEAELPWIYPLFMVNSNTFKAPSPGDRIWLWTSKKQYSEYWYIPFFHMDDDTQELLQDYENTEVILNRQTGSSNRAQIYHADNSGLVMKADQGTVSINQGGTVTLSNPQGKEVLLQEDIVKVGDKSGAYEPAVLGQKLTDLLTQFKSDMQALGTLAAGEVWTEHLKAGIEVITTNLENAISNIVSANVKLN